MEVNSRSSMTPGAGSPKGGRAALAILMACIVLILPAAIGCAPAASPTPTKSPAAAVATPAKPPEAAVATPSPSQPKPAATPTAPAKLVTARYGDQSTVANGPVYIAIEKGFFKDEGLDVQLIPFASMPLTIAPLASGDLDATGGTPTIALINAIDRGLNLKIVSEKGSYTKGYSPGKVVIRKDLMDSGQVKEPKDAKGKKIAVSALQSGAESIVAKFLKVGGLTVSDAEIVALGYPDMAAAFGNKSLDLAMMIEPTLSTVVDQGLVVPSSIDIATLYGGVAPIAILFFGEQFTKNTDAARKFAVGYIKGARAYYDAFMKGKNKDEMITILMKYTSIKDPAMYRKMEMIYIDPDGKMDLNAMKIDLDYFKAMGYYTGPLDIGGLVDRQFVDYAVQKLGPYSK